ncbi:MAG: hypothetical protein IPK17_39495 [Chloroflexi bacterium]|nr:hypothetical protein [Chloroflexota bacterium]
MAHSLEARVLSSIRFCSISPPACRAASACSATSRCAREAMRPLLPAFALARPRQPFGTPILNWFRDDPPSAFAVLLDDGGHSRSVPASGAGSAVAHFDGSAPQVEVVFRLLTLETWLKTLPRARTRLMIASAVYARARSTVEHFLRPSPRK